jgi:DNA (cytosine-5)-methyltransferase 1
MTEQKTIRILNLYAGIGGNRKLWSGDIAVTAVENVPEIAKIYRDFFPQDKVIIADAHQYLLEHFKEYDFIWSSPPCPTHSKIRQFSAVARGQNKPVYPDMKLYEEIIFLMHNFTGKWVVENVVSYYEPLIKPQELASHYFWANFPLGNKEIKTRGHNATIDVRQQIKGFDLSKYEGIDKQKILRNCVEPETGLHIFNMAFKNRQINLMEVMQDGKDELRNSSHR